MIHLLTQRLNAADRRYQRELGIGWLLRALPWALGLILVFLALDVVLHFGWEARVLLDAILAAVVLAGAGVMIYFAKYRRFSAQQTARLLESRDPALGSKLINWLQLREQTGVGADSLTAHLAQQAVAASETALGDRDLLALTGSPTRPLEKKRTWIALGVFVVLLGAFFPISSVVLPRFFDPRGDHPPYSFTRIDIIDPSSDAVVVPYGKSAVIKAGTRGHHPSDLYLSFFDPAQPGRMKTIPMYDKGDAGFYQAIDKVTSDLVVFAHTKNQHSLSKQRRLKVELIPKIEKAWVKISPPAYTGIAAMETPFAFKNLSALLGSEIQFRLQSNRPLAGGVVHLPGTPGENIALKSSGENEVAGSFIPKNSARLEFSVRDVAHNDSQDRPSAALNLTEDLPPDVSIDTPASDGFVAADFKAEVRLSASDDYGVKTLRIHRGLNENYSQPKTISFDKVTRSASETIVFDIPALGVNPGDVISLFAEAVDTAPSPHLVRSRVLHLTIISVEDYNQSLRQQVDISDIQGKYAALINEMQDLIDAQKQIAERAKELQETLKNGDAPAQKDAQTELDQLLAKQAETNQKLNQLADRMAKFVRETPLYDIERELQESLTQRATDLRASTAENGAALKEQLAESAASNTAQTSPRDALASLQNSAEKQLERLGVTKKQTQEEVLPPLQDMALMNALVNDLNAIKYLHEVQTTAASQARAYASRQDLTEEDRLALNQLAATERQVSQALSSTMQNLRKHADAAEKVFPNAAASGRDLADQMEIRRLSPIATQAAGSMLAGDGTASADLAERLRTELDNLFEDAQQQSGQMCQSLDQRLKLRRFQSGIASFQQMMQGRKFGFGQGMTGQGQQGMGGLDGFAASAGSNAGVFGNETIGSGKSDAAGGANGQVGTAADADSLEMEKGGKIVGATEQQRLSNENRSEPAIDEYRDEIDAYFSAVTK